MLQYGRIYNRELGKNMPFIEERWQAMLGKMKFDTANRYKLQASEDKVSELQAKLHALEAQLQSTETKSQIDLKASEDKVSELQAKVEDLEQGVQYIKVKSEIDLKASEDKVSELQTKLQAFEIQVTETKSRRNFKVSDI
jgi:hypothetical protein